MSTDPSTRIAAGVTAAYVRDLARRSPRDGGDPRSSGAGITGPLTSRPSGPARKATSSPTSAAVAAGSSAGPTAFTVMSRPRSSPASTRVSACTAAPLAAGQHTILEDPKGVFGFQNVLFVIDKPKYEARGGPRFMAIMDKVDSLLTEPAMRSMNAAVALDKKQPKDVASAFLRANKPA